MPSNAMTDAQRRRKAHRPTPAQRPPSFAGETLVAEPPTRPGANDGQVRPLSRQGSALVARLNARPHEMQPYPMPAQTMGEAMAVKRRRRGA